MTACDTRPYRGRTPTAYAGCMTVVPAAPIDRVYSSGPSYRQGLWVRRELLFFDEILVPWSREAGHGLGNALNQGDQDFISGMRFTRKRATKISKNRQGWNLGRAIPHPVHRC